MLAALGIKGNTNGNKSHILNDISRRRIHMLYLTVSVECEAHAEEQPKDKEKRHVTALSDKSESATRTAVHR
jgi:hypothetical protein